MTVMSRSSDVALADTANQDDKHLLITDAPPDPVFVFVHESYRLILPARFSLSASLASKGTKPSEPKN